MMLQLMEKERQLVGDALNRYAMTIIQSMKDHKFFISDEEDSSIGQFIHEVRLNLNIYQECLNDYEMVQDLIKRLQEES